MTQPQQAQPPATHTVVPPPNQDEAVQHAVELLLAGWGIAQLAQMLYGMFGISPLIYEAVLRATGGAVGHGAHARLQALGLNQRSVGAEVARVAARAEIFWRAAYLLTAAERINGKIHDGQTLTEALAGEKPNFVAHKDARRGRMDAAAAVGQAANIHGDLLGWYVDPMLNNEPECLAADGHNFRASEGTVLGWPGSVHRGCGCHAGPPIPGASRVNTAVVRARSVRFASRPVRLRNAG